MTIQKGMQHLSVVQSPPWPGVHGISAFGTEEERTGEKARQQKKKRKTQEDREAQRRRGVKEQTYLLTIQDGMQHLSLVQSPPWPGVHGMSAFGTNPSRHLYESLLYPHVEGWPMHTPPLHTGLRMLGEGEGHWVPSATESQKEMQHMDGSQSMPGVHLCCV